MEIRVKVNPRRNSLAADELAKGETPHILQRVAEVILGSYAAKHEIWSQDHGYPWQVGGGNNWWVALPADNDRWGREALQPDEILVAYRYGHGNEELMTALKTVLEWVLH